MKNFLLVVVLCAFAKYTSAQVVYSDSFDGDDRPLTQVAGCAHSIVDARLQFTADGSTAPYAPLNYHPRLNGKDIVLNRATPPKVYIKIKATNAPNVGIDLRDANGFITNLAAKETTISGGFMVYGNDYANILQDGGYGGLYKNAPYPVEPASINNIDISFNPAADSYKGAAIVDSISFGAPLETASGYEIRYNQVTYLKGRKKLINIASAKAIKPMTFSVEDSTGETVMTGMTKAPQLWGDAREYTSIVDVSSIDEVGTYRFITDENEISFKVSEDGYNDIAGAAFKYYYYNRASTAITAQYGGKYARPMGLPDEEVFIHASAASASRPAGTVISAPKGWFDAGDYNKYIVNSGISTYTLLAAYEHYPAVFKAKSFDIPENGNTLPDILDEVLWNLDWMLAMQDPEDGGVYHKLTGLNFSGIIMPADYDFDRYVVQKTTAAALDFAAVTAVASRIFADFRAEKPGYAAQLLKASKGAYSWAKANPTVYYQQPDDVKTGEYGDSNLVDEFQWAATELFITSGEANYKADIDIGQMNNNIPSWPDVASLALISIARHSDALQGKIDVAAAEAKLLVTADQLVADLDASPAKTIMTTEDYVWGSNGVAANQLVILINAYAATKDTVYLEAAFTGMDYLLGRNGTGYCAVTGFGHKSALDPHHRISAADNVALPVPGMMSGGPHSGMVDNCSYPNDYPASSYVDGFCSYSTNEVTINWNAPLVYSLFILQNYQDGG